MSSQVAASYAPDIYCIRLKSVFPAFADPLRPQGFETPQQAGFFIHEWLHYLHNNSTIHGFTAYSHALMLWSNIRPTLNSDGICLGDEALPAEHFSDILKHYRHLSQARKPQSNNLKKSLYLSDVCLESCKKQAFDIDGDEKYSCTVLICEYSVGGRRQENKIKIGCHEIVEYLASTLESKFVSLCGEAPIQSALDPYQLVKSLARLLASSLTESTIMRCAILSLQYPDPPHYLPNLLHMAHEMNVAGQNPDLELERMASNHIRANLPVMEKTVDIINEVFPIDEPFAYAVKYSIELMMANYKYRIIEPFFEIKLIEDFAKQGGAAFENAIEKFGIGFLIQERDGSSDGFKRDLIYDISKAAKQNPELSEGQRVWQAAFTYILSLFRTVPDRLTQPRQLRCPFFTACTADYRRDNPEICSSEPWKSQYTEHSKICSFGRAMINSRFNGESFIASEGGIE
ncbi:hypothetical protein [Pseudomonas fluorescens]|uniref:Uncharacterized protein n=1 Tax=Pseudomonas fluorescens TaxID=294 RepID=A0A5E6QE25_PSEFL|nr:hypothetical protein [Pseudomonas fluorescens]VVM53547.1 hypothetical protein PS624_00911 [Pseudomonas fluorescens]